MPINTDLSVSPYYDDYSAEKDFYKILFRPGVSVQARELNQLQTILQQQIERFGDNIFKEGTIIEGCDLTFHSVFPYVKIKDTQTDGKPVNISSLKGLRVKNSANLQANIIETVVGYESRNPDLNTLYVRYLNSGDDGNTSTFAADQVLTVFDPSNVITEIEVNNGSSGFSNSDSVVIMGAFAVQNSTGGTTFSNGFYPGDIINNGTSANVQIVSIDNTSNSEVYILSVKPLTTNLNSANDVLWTFSTNTSIINSNTGQVANLVSIVGSGATGSIVTDSLGQIDYVAITSTGSGYTTLPTVSVASTGANTTQIASANLEAKSFLAQITVANNIVSPIGTGYGMTVGDGVIYQKGYFSRVSQQLAIVEKYNSVSDAMPDGKVVGFDTLEDIINSNIDTSLLDNSIGTTNSSAPGANRLKLTPTLKVLSKADADANVHFFAITEFSAGRPFKQNRYTQYNALGSEMAKRTYEESGNYVLDQFILNTKSPTVFSNEAAKFDIQVDAGKAYINGYRVETLEKYTASVDKATEFLTSNNATISMNYGNYIKVKEVGGVFKFSTGDVVSLYNTAKQYASNTSLVGTTIAAAGTKIGEARMRSMVLDSGVPGTPECVYRLYLFDIVMNAGQNFKDTRSIYYAGTNKGIADIVLTYNPTSNSNIAQVFDNALSGLAFYSGVDAVKSISNVSYVYRTTDEGRTANTSGIITKSVTGNDSFPYSGTLSAADKSEIIVVPLANVATANIAGQVSATSGNATLTGTSTSFLTYLAAGDYIRVANSTASWVRRVKSISNNTILTLSDAAPSTITGNTGVYFLQNMPIQLDRTGRTANISANGTLLTIDLGSAIATNTAVAVTCNIKASNVGYVSKTVNRDVYVRLNIANNIASTNGPWCLGISDVFRLKNVYKGSNNTFTANSAGIIDVTNDFYVDHNQNENYYNVGYLYKKPKSTLAISNTDVFLVKVDNFTVGSEGVKHLSSYPVLDAVVLANSTSTVNTLEIPEMYDTKGNYYDLRDMVDIRPQVINSANVTTSEAAATINPVEPSSGSKFGVDDKKFPAPDSDLTATIQFYVPRKDRVVVGADGNIRVLKGTPGANTLPDKPTDALIINDLIIPAYPSIPAVLSNDLMKIADTKIANEKYLNKRLDKYKISTPVTANQRVALQPKAYRMEDIATLERRISDLEYYVSFSLAELAVKQRIIPGSITSNVDRFKFGFFVDSFSDYAYADVNSPEYLASIIDGKLSPRVEELNIEFIPNTANSDTVEALSGDVIIMPFNESTILSQMVATDGPVVAVVPAPVTNTPNTSTTGGSNTTPTVVEPVIKQTITTSVIKNKNTMVNIRGTVYEETQFLMSSLPGPVSVYYNFRDNKDAIEIFYSNSPNPIAPGSTPLYNSLNCVAISAAEKTQNAYDIGHLEGFTGPVLMSDGKYAVEDNGKLTWVHNPANGRYVTIRVTKYKKSGQADNWKGVFYYRIYYPTDIVETKTTTSVLPQNWFTYNGSVVRLSPAEFTIQTSTTPGFGWVKAKTYISDSQIFSISISGLKPNTIHNFFLDGVDHTSKCKQIGKVLGGGLTTDSSGGLTFEYYYDAGIDEVTSDFAVANKMAASVAGSKTFTVKNLDSTSSATQSLNIKSYVVDQINSSTTNLVISAKTFASLR